VAHVSLLDGLPPAQLPTGAPLSTAGRLFYAPTERAYFSARCKTRGYRANAERPEEAGVLNSGMKGLGPVAFV
jgi:hypothetical protein